MKAAWRRASQEFYLGKGCCQDGLPVNVIKSPHVTVVKSLNTASGSRLHRSTLRLQLPLGVTLELFQIQDPDQWEGAMDQA